MLPDGLDANSSIGAHERVLQTSFSSNTLSVREKPIIVVAALVGSTRPRDLRTRLGLGRA